MRDLFTDFGVDLGGSYGAAKAHDGKAEADRAWSEAKEKAKQEEEPTGARPPFHERPRPPSIVRPSAEDVKCYGVPEVKPEPDRVRAATWDETVRYSAAGGVDAPPREPRRPDIDLKEAAQTWAERRWGPGR